MPGQGRPVPSSFPCLCRAIYSWGGETKRDLGFVEGDLIECLNAGDGQWWMGRLRRNKTVGLFPSNFVEIIDDGQTRPTSRAGPAQQTRPVSRQTRPVSRAEQQNRPVSRGEQLGRPVSRGEPLNRPVSRAEHQNRPVSRGEYHNRPVSRAEQQNRPLSRAGATSPMFHEPGRNIHRATSPSPVMYRSTSPLPGNNYDYGRSPSPQPPMHQYQTQNFRAPSPQPPMHQSQQYRAPSPQPPMHQNFRSPSPIPPQHQDYYVSRAPSPMAPPHQNSYIARVPSPAPHHISRTASPAPSFNNHHHPHSRAVSPAPSMSHQIHHPRAVSPAHSMMYNRAPSPHPQTMDMSPPPPAPPPHRYGGDRAVSPSPSARFNPNSHLTPGPSRAPSPNPNMGGTPSPLRNAMEDVMSSLEHMTSHDDYDRPGADHDPFSPKSFANEFRASPTKQLRPQTSMGLLNHDDDEFDDPYDSRGFSRYPDNQRPPTLNTYSERMEDQLRRFQLSNDDLESPRDDYAPSPPPKNNIPMRPRTATTSMADKRKSAFELGNDRPMSRPTTLQRFTTFKSTSTTASSNAHSVSTNATNSTSATSTSLMSGMSAGGFSATSAGSLARRKAKAFSMIGTPGLDKLGRPETPQSGSSMSGSGGSGLLRKSWRADISEAGRSSPLGGLAVPKAKKTGFFKKIINSAKTTTANARSMTFAQPLPTQQFSNIPDIPVSKSSTNIPGRLGEEWVEVRRDVARANSLSRNEREERQERAQLAGQSVLKPVEQLDEDVEGDEAMDGGVVKAPADFATASLALVDKTARFINNLPPFTTPESLATMHICRPYRTDVQRLRAVFTWISEKVAWERPSAPLDDMNLEEQDRAEMRRVIQSRRGSPEEVANVVMQMCKAVGIQAEVVKGYLKAPGEALDIELCPRPNHYWNAVVADGEWRMMDCSLASPTHPRRGMYSSAPSTNTDFFYFLTPPSKFCWTHVPLDQAHQHMVPPLPMATLLALPVVTPVFFQYNLQMINFDTSLLQTQRLETAQIDFVAPYEIECVAEVEARGFAIDADGDVFETGEIIKKRALAQVAWEDGVKTYRVKAIVPSDMGHGVLKVYAGRRGLMHSIKDNPHSLAFAVPITHTGENPPYDFIPRHPTPHAQRHDLYVSQPQCYKLATNNTFVFQVRQHPAAGPGAAQAPSSSSSNLAGIKPAKLAIQTPSGKIIRLARKADSIGADNGMTWETIAKCTERGPWRALVLADRSARWCVYAEWLVQ